jgi:hypothetical protein
MLLATGAALDAVGTFNDVMRHGHAVSNIVTPYALAARKWFTDPDGEQHNPKYAH